MFKYM